jgi:PAS domain S-box-containing protein
MSSQGEKLVFREPGELIGKSIWDEFPGLLGTPFEKMYRDAMKEKIFSTVTDYYPDHDRWYEVLTYPSPHGVTVYFRDISQRKRAESNLAFLANLQRDFAPPATTREIVALASTQIADYLQLSHCLFVEIDEAQKTATVTHDKHAPDAMDLTGVYELGNFHTAEERKKLSAGTAIAINNVRDGKRPATAADSFEALGIRALITASYISQGKWKFALSAQCDKPREWRTDEQELLSELSSRIYLRLERARAEEELRESEQRFRSLFDSIDEGFCIIKMIFDENNQPRDYRFLRANPAFEKLTGLKDALGKTARELVPHLEECWFETLGRVALTGEPARFENEAAATNRWFEIHASRDGDSSSRRVAVVFSDITERKLAERERERLLAQEQRAREIAEAATRAKDEFIAVVSHELRNPLNAILGYQRLLRQSNTLDRTIQENYLDIIEKSARQQQRLIEDLLDTARIISGKLKLDIRPINFVRVLQDTLNSVRPSAQIKQIALTVDVAESVRANITGDADRLQQVIWNLLSNAIKFTPERGAVMVHLTDLSGYLRLMIADTGKGIAPHLIAQIFDRFHQADSSSTRRHGGLGLGLALVKQLVEMHGGTIEASSPGVGQGATFIVTLPMQAHVPLVTDPAPSAVPLTPSTLLTGLRILVVDDEADARDIVTAILQTQGARVTSVASAATALAVLTNTTHAFDVLVSDIGMPDTDGYKLMRQVRQRGFNLPGIAVTAFGRMEDRLRALTAGFQMHVPKPIEPEELIAVIRSLVK